MTLWPSRIGKPATWGLSIAHLLAALCGTTIGTPAAAVDHAQRVRTHAAVATRSTQASALENRRTDAALYRPLAFAVVANLPPSPDQATRAQAWLQWIGTQGKVAFVLDLGNFKTVSEPCSDALFAARYELLDSSPVPLVYVPGQNDWADCGQSASGATDPIERLDALRDVFLSSPMSLGVTPMRLIRQSELPAFRPYRENTRWIQGGIVFASLNVPGDNNHYYTGGGRNGEFEDREVANRTWIARAVTDARRRHARGLVFFFEGDPHFPREIRSGFSRWLNRLSGGREPDGFAALRRDLVAASHNFDGPVLVFYAERTSKAVEAAAATRQTPPSNGGAADSVVIESILHESSGDVVHRLKRIEVGTPWRLDRWLRVSMPASHVGEGYAASARGTNASRKESGAETAAFRFTMESVPADLPPPALATDKSSYPRSAPASEDDTTMPREDDAAGVTGRTSAAGGAGSTGGGNEENAESDGSGANGNISTPVLLPLPPLGDTPPILRPASAVGGASKPSGMPPSSPVIPVPASAANATSGRP